MEKIDKNKDPFIYEIQFSQVKNFKSIPWLYIPLIFFNIILYAFKLYQLIHPAHAIQFHIPYFALFIIQLFLCAFVVVLTVVSICFKTLNNLWAYTILICETMGMLFVETTMECFEGSKWCENDIKFQIGALLLLVAYTIIIWLRSSFYYPFFDNFNYISMSSSAIVLFDFGYKLFFGLITNLSFMDSVQTQKKFILLFTLVLYCVYQTSTYYCNPLINKCWLIVNIFLTWSVIIIYLLPYFYVISTMIVDYKSTMENLFWYLWGYSIPCMVVYVVIQNSSVDWEDGWKMLFMQAKHEVRNVNHLFLMISQFKEKLKIIKKSQQKTNDPLFKTVWMLIQQHNKFCDHSECPLGQLRSIQINRHDDFLEQKRLGKTIQACYAFGLYHVQRKKDKFPNLLQLSIEIANYELEVFQNRQKGLLLYTNFYIKDNIDAGEKFKLYYLKKKIEQLFIDNEHYSKSNKENQISEFRHNIEVSVSMLAEFWYFLADPKCNLKKLYDLANVLFPLKIGVDSQWKNIMKLKNIQSYHLYARYLIKMFNDKQKGLKILDEAKKIEQELKNKQEIQVDAEGNSNLGVEENGIIFLQFDGKNPGVMYQVNLAAEKIFGYNKGELVNRKVNDIMPRLFSIFHDRILQNYQQTNKTKMMNKERVVWGRSKDGYLFNFTIIIKPVKNLLSQSSEVYGSIKRETWVKQGAFLTIDVQNQISEVSSGLLGIYPELHGKVNAKKKIHMTEIIPNFLQLKAKLLDEKQGQCQYQIQREFKLSEKQTIKQITTFNLTMDQVHITIAGHIGYILKFQKIINTINAQKQPNLSMIGQSRLKMNDYRFIYQIHEAKKEEIINQNINQLKPKINLKYKGGIVLNTDQMAKSCISSASKYFTKFPIQQQKKVQQNQKVYFGQTIKTKRLQGKQIREIHMVSEQSEYDIGQVQNEQQQNQGVGNIKPSQLSSILQRQSSNKNIFCLKVVTFIILTASCLLCIIQYVSVWQKHNIMIESSEKVRKLNQLGSEILYMKMFTTKFSLFPINEDQYKMFTDQINLLDIYLDLYPYNMETRLTYNDGSKEKILLGFGLNKLMSEANSIKILGRVLDQEESHVFFIHYNTINGLTMTTKVQNQMAFNTFNQSIIDLSNICLIYMGVSFCVFLVGIIIKNFLLRNVLKKKSQILQVFFQIPRKACSSIQKQCQKFIQRLSSENEEDMQQFSMASEGSDAGMAEDKKQHKQKKRTVMGEEKTTNNYIIATVAFLLMLTSFHLFTTIYHETSKQEFIFSMQAQDMIFQLERQTAIITNLINSFSLNPAYPFLQNSVSKSIQVIDTEFKEFIKIYSQISIKFYLIGNIFDQEYLKDYNRLFYNDLCVQFGKNQAKCQTVFGENYGMNVVLSQYLNLIRDKYEQLKQFYKDGTISQTQSQTLLTEVRLQNQQKIQYLLKEHWRELTYVVKAGLNRLIKRNGVVVFSLMLTICIVNFTVLLFCWLRFYQSLQQKIAASEYILTFIPIDEINRNPKIANYIKEQILEKR